MVINKIDILEKRRNSQGQDFVLENAFSWVWYPWLLSSAPATLRRKLRPGKRAGCSLRGIHPPYWMRQPPAAKLLNPPGEPSRKHLSRAGSGWLSLNDLDLLADVESVNSTGRICSAISAIARRTSTIFWEWKNAGRFFDETAGRSFDLLSKPRIQQEFERQAVADFAPMKESTLIDWLVESDLRQ
jgi:hypothetical protein